MTTKASLTHLGPLSGILLVTAVLIAACANTSPRAKEPHCPPELLLGPVGTPFTTPPSMRDHPKAIRDFRSRLADVGVGPESPLERYKIDSLIDTDGTVILALIMPPTGDPEVDSAVVRAAREIEYIPGKVDGEPVCVWLGFSGMRGTN